MSKEVAELNVGNKNSKEYELEAILDSVVYVNKLESGYLQGIHYPVAWKGYLKEENTWEPLSAVQHLKKLISFFHKNYLEKPTATSPPIDFVPLIAKSIVKSTTKQTRGRLAKSTSKRAKKNWMKLAYMPVKSFSSQNLITDRPHSTWELFLTFLRR